PASTRAFSGIGYGPLSLWSPYAVNVIGTFFCEAGTVSYGIPYDGFEPKSGCRCTDAPMLRTHAAECELTLACEMSSRHGLSAGNSGQPASSGALVAAA